MDSILKISFSDSARRLHTFFEQEGIDVPTNLFVELLQFLSKACIYEEEEQKIRPSLIVGSNLLDYNFQKITQATFLTFIKEEKNISHFTKRIKSMLPFCNNGWRLFVDIGETDISYGIIRNFNGPSGVNFDDLLNNLSETDKSGLNVRFVLIDVISNFEIILKGNNNTCSIDFRLLDENNSDSSNAMFCSDLLSAYGNENNKALTAYSKIIRLFSQKLHGSICLIVKHDCVLPDEILNDGIFLEEPIDIYSILTDDLNSKNLVYDTSYTISAHEKYYAFTGLLLEMLNIDGITIVDTKGRIRAYNVFVKPETSSGVVLAGGARKRAASFLHQQHNANYVGVYFQSQDGMSSYERIEAHV